MAAAAIPFIEHVLARRDDELTLQIFLQRVPVETRQIEPILQKIRGVR